MIHKVDDRFLAEAQRFALRFACESCAHFDPTDHSCSNGYPTRQHLEQEHRRSATIVFCKLFELA